MTLLKTSYNRRSFLKSGAAIGGGFVLGISWLTSCAPEEKEEALVMPNEWFDINAYLKIGDNGVVTIYCPNPEFGQNVKTSMPMLIAEELDVSWDNVLVEMAEYNAELYGFQFTGGSRGIMSRWEGLRMAGATAKHMLKEAAAQLWEVPVSEITTNEGVLTHEKTGKSVGYGEVASAASAIAVPEEVELKDVKDFKIIGTSRKNVDGPKIVTGQPVYALDIQREGMLFAMIEHPPAFGMELKSFDESAAKAMPGIKDVFSIKTYKDDFEKGGFDVDAFNELVVVVGNSTWEVMNAKKQLKVEWQPFAAYKEVRNAWGGKSEVTVPAGLENTDDHISQMEHYALNKAKIVRRDGDPEAAFEKAARVLERTYSAPYLAHNCMEPINVFAHVEGGKVKLAGPLQAPGMIEPAIAASLGVKAEDIDIEMTRMGGGFGRRAYSHYMIEAALISQKTETPIKLIYSREDDMTNGIYRPTYQATYRAAIDADNQLTALHVNAGGVPESPLFANRFPAGALDNYLAEDWSIESNITTGAFRAPRSNFMAGAEQSFLDEVAEVVGKDPIEFRLEMLQRAKNNPVGDRNDYDADRYAGVLELVKEKSNWGEKKEGVHRGVSAYFCHGSYAAHVLDLVLEDGKSIVQNVCCAIDCGIVVNPDAAKNMAEGGIIDGIGNALYGEMTFKDGAAQKNNFHQYRMIRMNEAPQSIDVHFVKNEINPTGLGEPPFPPIFGAIANAMYEATDKRYYKQPFLGDKRVIG